MVQNNSLVSYAKYADWYVSGAGSPNDNMGHTNTSYMVFANSMPQGNNSCARASSSL